MLSFSILQAGWFLLLPTGGEEHGESLHCVEPCDDRDAVGLFHARSQLEQGRRQAQRHLASLSREQAKTSAGGVAAIVGAALGLQAAGYDPNRPRPPAPRAADPLAPVRGTETPAVFRADIDEEAATRACKLATEDEAQRQYPHALLEAVEAAEPLKDVLLVRGTIRLRAKKADPGELRAFRCRVDAQAVRMVAIDPPETRAPR